MQMYVDNLVEDLNQNVCRNLLNFSIIELSGKISQV